MALPGPAIQWQIDLSPLVDKPVWIETRDGHIKRTDTFKEPIWQPFMLNGHMVDLPVAILLGSGDSVTFDQLKTLRLRESHE